MSELLVKTRGGANPQGKPRVYFSCAPEDFAAYFPLLSADILRFVNCAIYCRPPQDADEETAALARDLEEMQLFVVAITDRFLHSGSLAYRWEYGFAVQHHIPVLPIAVEPGLAVPFREQMERLQPGFGSMQFLDQTSTDLTEIPYAEKLEKKLGQILAGDELAARIRAAFDATIFLSYRKRDRASAKELMALIHRIPFCRDIAVWYDEFLVPGEKWDSTIAAMMQQCALVTLAVTPSLTEPDNYVIRHEYPDARKANKPVVPVQMTAVDAEKLKALFPGLPQLVDGRDSAAVCAALKRIAVSPSAESPEHNYLIGLAYLGAIDVERDPARALSLIEGAAQAGLPEAMQKLSDMYRTGDGVEHDFAKAVDWQETLVAARRAAMEKDGTEESGRQALSALWNYGDLLRDSGWPARAQAAYQDMETAAEQLLARFPDAGMRRSSAVACMNLARTAADQQDLAAQRRWYEKALDLCGQPAPDGQSAAVRADLVVCHAGLGDLARAQGDPDRAQTHYEAAAALCEALAAETNAPAVRADLIACLQKLGALQLEKDAPEAAKTQYGKALQLCEALCAEASTVKHQALLASSYSCLGSAETRLGRLDAAKACYEKALALDDELISFSKMPRLIWDGATQYEALGHIAQQQGLLDEANRRYHAALAVFEAFAQQEDSPATRKALQALYADMGDIEAAQGHPAAALERYQQAYALARRAADETDAPAAQRELAVCCGNLGDAQTALKQLPAAKDRYEQERAILARLAEKSAAVELRRDLCVCWNRLGNTEKALGNLEAARACYLEYLALSRQIAKETSSARAFRDLAVCYGKLGDTEKALARPKQAGAYYRASLDLRKALAQQLKSETAYDDCAAMYYKLWALDTAQNLELLERAASIWKQLSAQRPQNQSYREHYEMAAAYLRESTGGA